MTVTRFLARRGLRLTDRGRFAVQASALGLAVIGAVLATRGYYLAPSGWEPIPH